MKGGARVRMQDELNGTYAGGFRLRIAYEDVPDCNELETFDEIEMVGSMKFNNKDVSTLWYCTTEKTAVVTVRTITVGDDWYIAEQLAKGEPVTVNDMTFTLSGFFDAAEDSEIETWQ